MGITTDWSDASQQYCIIRIEAPWTWDEYQSNVDSTVSDIQTVTHPVALIIDLMRSGTFPKGDILGHFRYLESHMPSNVFASIPVGAPMMMTSFVKVYTQIRPNVRRRVHFASSIVEAQALAQKQLDEIRSNTAN